MQLGTAPLALSVRHDVRARPGPVQGVVKTIVENSRLLHVFHFQPSGEIGNSMHLPRLEGFDRHSS